jgi:hypothetical protein
MVPTPPLRTEKDVNSGGPPGIPGFSLTYECGIARGHWGSFLVAEHLRSWMIDPNVVHDWLNGHLGLDGYPIAKKGWNWSKKDPLRLPDKNGQ